MPSLTARPLLSTVDQAFSSLSNALILVVLARVSDATTFGVVSLYFLCITASVGVNRGFVGAKVLLASGLENLTDEVRLAAASTVVIGTILGSTGILVAHAAELPTACVLLSVGWPIVLAQDVVRYGCIAAEKQWLAVAADVSWAVVAVALLALSFQGGISPAQTAAGWVVGSAFAFSVLAGGLRLRLRFSGFRMWLGRDSAQRWAFGLESTVSALWPIVSAAIITGALGLSATGALRGVSTFTGPISLLLSALPLAVVPYVARRAGPTDGRALWSSLRWVAMAVSPLGLIVAGLPWTLPGSWGSELLGATWAGAVVLLPFVGLEYVALAWMYAALTGLRALGLAGPLFKLRLAFVTSSLASTVVTVQHGDLRLVCLGAALVAMVFAGLSVALLFSAQGAAQVGQDSRRGGRAVPTPRQALPPPPGELR